MLAIFFVNGALLASWVPHIPLIQQRLGLSEGMLGIALLGVALGSIISMPLSGIMCHQFGSRRVTTIATFSFCLTLPLPILASNLPLLIITLVALGAATGSMDVSMNSQAVIVEHRYGKAIMSSFHGFFSLGNLIGAGMGVLVLSAGAAQIQHTLIASIFLGIISIIALPRLLPKEAPDEENASNFRLPTGPLLGLGALTFIVFLAEGAMADWSAVYLQNSHAAGPGISAIGFAAFALMMAVGRLSGDKFVRLFGPVATLRIGAPIAAIGLGLGLFLNHPIAAIIGFGCVGLGLSNLVPIFFSAAGRTPNISSSAAIAAVATAGYTGLLAGPPIIGFVAEVISLPATLGLLAVCLLIPAVFAYLIPRET